MQTPEGHSYVGVDFARSLCGVSIVWSGEAMEAALRDCCQGIKIGKILVQRKTDVCNDMSVDPGSPVKGDSCDLANYTRLRANVRPASILPIRVESQPLNDMVSSYQHVYKKLGLQELYFWVFTLCQ